MKRALAVGISTFDNRDIAPLAGCMNDATLMIRMLQQQFGFMPEDCSTLVNASATRAAIIDGLEWLVSDIADGDVIVLSIATHGTWIGEQGRKTNADIPAAFEKTYLTYDYSESNILLEREVSSILDRIPARANCYCIIDTCYSGVPDETPLHTGALHRGHCSHSCDPCIHQKANAPRGDVINRIVICGCADNERSYDVPTTEGNHGLLTICLYETLEQRSWSVTVDEAFDEVRNRVSTLAKAWRLTQTPQLRCPQKLVNNILFR